MPTLDDALDLYADITSERDRTWKQQAACRREDVARRRLWTASEGEYITIAGVRIPGIDAQEAAAMICSGCPVQWDCVRWAIEVGEVAGVWGMTMRELRWLSQQRNAIALIDAAEDNGISPRTAVRIARGRAV